MLQMHKMRHFAERLECWLFSDRFSENLLQVGESRIYLIRFITLNLFCGLRTVESSFENAVGSKNLFLLGPDWSNNLLPIYIIHRMVVIQK